MSGLSGVGSSTSSTQTGTLGNAAPISFPGIASGIDYNAIIEKLTSLTLAQNQPLTAESSTLASANKELLKISGLVQQVQQAIMQLGDPSLFNSFAATVSNGAFASAQQISGQTPQPGTTTILSQTLATSTQLSSDSAANKAVDVTQTLTNAGFQITPSNGSGSSGGKFTVNGTQLSYDAGTDTVNGALPATSIVSMLNGISGIKASFQNDELTITSTGSPLSLGSASDSGNLEQIFKLDTAQIVGGQESTSTTGGVTATDTLGGDGATDATGTLTINGNAIAYNSGETVQQLMNSINAVSGLSASIQGGNLVIATTTGAALTINDSNGDAGSFMLGFNGGMGAATTYQSVTSSAPVGGINPNVSLNLANSTTALNSGTTFSINGVAFTINPATMNLQDVINMINASNAGVTAAWNTTAGQLQLVAKATGPQSIVLGSPNDTSNFLQAFGLTTAGATTQTGQQASVTYQTASGGTATIYSNSNAITNIIPGVTLTLQQSTTSANPYTVTVAASNTNLISAINTFVSTYNAAINEINSSTTPPVVQTQAPGTPLTSGTATSSQVVPGGVLFDNSSVQELKDQLTNLVSGLTQTGSSSYNSFASIGLLLDSSIAVITSDSTSGSGDSNDSDDTGGLSTQTFDGTSGKLQALDAVTFDAAMAANPAAVQSMFTGTSGILSQLGTYLTYVTGSPTQLGPNGNFLGNAPDVSLLQGIENTNSAQIDSINQQIESVNDQATAQANQLRAQFTASETMIAQLQQEQASLSSILGTSSTSSTSS
ncbi:MAG TPA: flagellar filament capping protein FliD [Candidatus Baltobacteraceae bacterium]|jgi:flagellar hook-associated protein 2